RTSGGVGGGGSWGGGGRAAEVEGVEEIVSAGVAGGEGGEVPAPLDELEDRGGVVLGVVDEALLGGGGDDDGGDAQAGAPAVDHRRGDVVPGATVLVVGDDDRGVLPVGAVLDGADEVDGVLLALADVGVAGVLVVGAEGLDEGDRREGAVFQ